MKSKLRRIVAAGTAVAVLFITACSSKDSNNATHHDAATVNLEATVITLTSPGAHPQSILKYNLHDSVQRGVMDITQGFSQDTTTSNTDLRLDSTTMSLPYTAHGDTITVGKPTGSNATLNSDIATAEGFRLKTNKSATGVTSQATFTAPTQASPTARASVERALTQYLSTPVVFPTDPIGVGAQWDVRVKVNDPSPAVKTITYTLKKHEGTSVVLDATIHQRSSTRSLSLSEAPNAPLNAKGSLDIKDSTTTTDAGTLHINLSTPLPVAGTLDSTTTTTYAANTKESSDRPPSINPAAPGHGPISDEVPIVQKNKRAITWK
ncbi:hypothetical protein ACGE24_03235 [Corynebacterium kroppenstedtii]